MIGMLRFELRDWLGRFPWIFFLTYGLKGKNRDMSIARDTDLVIEGYPRSANTFAVVAFQHANPGLKLAHHLHVPAQILRAARWNIPALVLVRNPEDAVVSILLRNPRLSMAWALQSYCDFYRIILPYRERFLVARFEDVVKDFPSVVASVNRRFDKAYRANAVDRFETEKVFKEIETMDSDALKTPNPSPVRDRLKPDLIASLRRQEPALLKRAESVFQEFLAATSVAAPEAKVKMPR